MPRGLRYFALGFFAIPGLTAQRAIVPGMAIGGSGAMVNTQQPQSGPPPGAGQFPDRQMPIFLSGTVMMDGGAGPAADVAIQRICSGAPRTVAFTNSKGHFNFQWGASAGIVPEASDSGPGNGLRAMDDLGANGIRTGGLPGQSAQGCELIANAPGFQLARLDLTSHGGSDNPDLGMIVLHRLVGVEGTSVSVTALNAPKDARKAWEKGVDFLHKSRTAEAEKELEKAVEIYPKYANAWLDLGRAREQQQAEALARDAFLKAIDADNKLVGPYVELGKMAVLRQNWPDAARYLDRALQLDPVDYPRLWYEDAVADYNTQNFDRAEKSARVALRVLPGDRDPRANRLLGLVLMNKRDYAGADEALRAYLELSPHAKDMDRIKADIDRIDSHLGGVRPGSFPDSGTVLVP
jgi:tetratricopeptide (TPR) repeat protein